MGLMDIVRTRQAAVSTSAPIEVAVRHIPYVEAQWRRLEAAREALATKQEYLRTVGSLGVKVDALTRVADAAVTNEAAIRKGEVDLDRIKKLLAFGCEPTTPSRDWFCGRLTEPPKGKDGRYPRERWPQRGNWGDSGQTRVYEGPIPARALQRYAAVSSLLDDVRVYAPTENDFRVLRDPEPFDPVLIGMIEFLGEDQYFEIDRWDVDKDLATIFGR